MSLGTPPETIRYQGRLTDDAGVPLSGMHSLAFAVFDAPGGGAQCWAEALGSLALSDGTVDVLLGSITPLPSLAFTDGDPLCAGTDRWLEVTVDGSVLTPRQRLASVPFAQVTDRLGDKTSSEVLDRANHTGSQPPGTISPQGSGSGLNADTIDDFDSGMFVKTNGTVPMEAALDMGGNNIDNAVDIDGIADQLTLSVNGSEKVRITDVGNVGIGTTDPSTRLWIASTDGTPHLGLHSEAVSFSYAGNLHNTLLIGTRLQATSGPSEGVFSIGYGTGQRQISFGTASGSDFATASFVPHVTITDDGILVARGLIRADSLASGSEDVCRSGGHYLAACGSARRFKDDVEDLQLGGLETVGRLRPVEFRWKDGGERDLGFVAEEVAVVDPILATYDDAGDLVGVKYRQLTAVLVKALQEQRAEFEAAEAIRRETLDGLVRRIDSLEREIKVLSDGRD
jgi:hypothetical protein